MPVATDAALRPLPLRKNITPNNPPATAPTAVLINAVYNGYFSCYIVLLLLLYLYQERKRRRRNEDY
jgi:hypothetical protein